MSMENYMDPEDVDTIRAKIGDKICPCNIWGLIKELEERIKLLEEK